MKKICVFGTAFVLLSGVFVSCKNNRGLQNSNSTTGVGVETSTEQNLSSTDQNQNIEETNVNTSTATTTGVSTISADTTNTFTGNTLQDNSGCVDKTKKKLAYTCHKAYTGHGKRTACAPKKHTHFKAKKAAPECEQVVAVEQKIETPPPPPPPAPEPVVEKQSTFSGYVQKVTAPVKKSNVWIAPEAGINLNNMYRRDENYTTSNMLKVGYHVGFMVNIGADHWAFQPGLRYSMKGSEITSTRSTSILTVESKDKLTLHYIELPANIVYKFGERKHGRFMIGAGPYLSYLANAQDKSKLKVTSYEGPTPVTTVYEGQRSLPIGHDNEAGNLERWDWGAGAFLGYEGVKGTYFKAGTQFGLMDIQKSDIDGQYYNRNYNFSFTVGHLIGKK